MGCDKQSIDNSRQLADKVSVPRFEISMDPAPLVSPSPTTVIDFGHCPRTPTSNRRRDAHECSGKENSRSAGSLHRRIWATLRSKSQDSPRASDNGSPSPSPTAKKVTRRQPIVDLLHFISTRTHISADEHDYDSKTGSRRMTDNAPSKQNVHTGKK